MTEHASWLLALDTATSRVVVAAGTADGRLLGERTVPAEHRHGERLLAEVDALVAGAGLDLADLAGVIVGTGPGAFTGLRAGIATAKTLAHELDVPIAGISTAEALFDAAAAGGADGGPNAVSATVLLLPAGPHDRVEARRGRPPHLLPGGIEPDLTASDVVVAVDLGDRAPAAAGDRGATASAGLGAALLRLGLDRLADGSDDPATLVPEYVTLPRGALSEPDERGVSWSHDRR